eukprot:1421092-Pleurochrysis_carterae.AAC.1
MLPASCAMWAIIVENPVSSRTVAGVGAQATEGAAAFPSAGTMVSTGVCVLSFAAGMVGSSRIAGVECSGMGAMVFLFVGRVALAGARAVAVREAAGATAFPTAGVAFSVSADGARGGDGAACSPVALADLHDVILAV